MHRLLASLVLLGFVGPPAGNAGDEAVLKALHAQGKAAAKATLEGDYEKLAAYTYPKLVELIGGKEKFVSTTKALMKMLEEKGIKVISYQLEAAKETHATEEHLFGILPASLKMSFPDGTLTQKSYLLGISTDKGKTWKFADGAGMDNPKAKEVLLPVLPKSLKLPRKEAPKIEKN